jgi:hypothetical protein
VVEERAARGLDDADTLAGGARRFDQVGPGEIGVVEQVVDRSIAWSTSIMRAQW